MKFYIQLNDQGYITDCITYEYNGYIPVEFAVPLPDKFISGAYKYLGNNTFEFDAEKLAKLEPALETDQLRADIDYIAIMTGVDLNV